MSKTAIRIFPDGRIVGIAGAYDYTRHTQKPVIPRRASRVEPVESGPYAGYWYADMSPLSDRHQYCLYPPRKTRQQTLDDEYMEVRRWLASDTA